MADTTPNETDSAIANATQRHINHLEKELEYYKAEDARKQKACVRIYRIFGEDMHSCMLNLDLPSRMAWMQKIAQEASIKTVSVETAVDEVVEEATNVEVLKTKKPPKVVGVGQAGEKSGH